MKKKHNYDKFQIGVYVEVKRCVCRNIPGDSVATVKRHNLPDGKKVMWDGAKIRVGVITGCLHMALGSSEFIPDCGYVFEKKGSVMVWRVRFSLLGKEYCALPEDLNLKTVYWGKFPVSSNVWSKLDREAQGDCMADVRRDKKGRWCE